MPLKVTAISQPVKADHCQIDRTVFRPDRKWTDLVNLSVIYLILPTRRLPEAWFIMIRILLAEDEEAMRTYLARALHNAGFEVVAVDRSTAALPLLEGGNFDLLLSDIVMPEMDGIELAQRCSELSPHTKVIFITGFAGVTLKATQELPEAKVLSKPFHLRDLVLEVQRVFGQASAPSI
jgi:two-component system cell cycle response regulator CpdR